LRLNLADATYLDEAQTVFEVSMKKLLGASGFVLHTKAYKNIDNAGNNTCQLRCYFAFD
jgi:hypothetical protein